ncbi:MAG: RdgB/HAM1 family non-canonical purine NTP pyrophosphatase [Alphaproteobacteria bacterium]|nr:RdgB/HAM1 family non-canonical purine NTP pyrophosphatase [Alphaproteobacteria bacterium]
MSEVVLASNNAHKLIEYARILEPMGLRLRPLSDFPDVPEPPETAPTFEGNALQKARFVHARTGLPCVADDSGLEVDALGGAPGVLSKRFTPEATAASNNVELLRRMQGEGAREARFVCALAVVTGIGEEVWRGTVEGGIALAPRGEGGFGYDPLFLPLDTPGRTMAELSGMEKDAISHRGQAARRLPEVLDRLLDARR